MAYATNAEVLSEFPSLTYASATTTGVTSGEADSWLDRFSAIIDSYLSGLYTTPITGTESLKVVKEICLMMTVSKFKRKLYILSGSKQESQRQESEDLWNQAILWLTKLQTGEIKLTDAPAGTGAASAPQLVADSYSRKNDKDPFFDIEEQQW